MALKIQMKDIAITPQMLSFVAAIDEFKGAWQATSNLNPDRLSTLKHVATIESIGASTRIEGVTLKNVEIETLLQQLSVTSFKSRDEEEVAGYADLMSLIYDCYAEMEISENHIKQLHTVLLKYSTKDARHRGEYKTTNNSVGAFVDGKLKAIVFETASPFETPYAMADLIGWYHTALSLDWHPCLVIGVFIVVFLAIHPFQDGNGRLSRALTTLMLLKHGYSYVPYSSHEKIIEENKVNYYKALQLTQLTLRSDSQNYTPWLLFFLTCLHQQKNVLALKLEKEKMIQSLPKAAEEILVLLESHGKLSISELEKLTGLNRNTLKSHLRQLVAHRRILQHGERKGGYYSRS